MSDDDGELGVELQRLAGTLAPGECPAPERWLELALGRVDGREAEALRAHLESCPVCAEVARDALGFAAAMAAPSAVARLAPARRWLPLVAAAGLAAIVLALWFGRAAEPEGARELARWSSAPLEPPRLAAVAIDDELLFRGGSPVGAAARARLLEGFALLDAGRAAEARAPLRLAAGAADTELADEARWYLALAELRAGDRPAAARALEPLRAGRGARSKQAQDLARALEAGR